MVSQRLNPFEHALKRPDVYIGSVHTETREAWHFNPELSQIVSGKMTYNPGLVRIFGELLSNAVDHSWRSASGGHSMKKIKVTGDPETGRNFPLERRASVTDRPPVVRLHRPHNS